MKPPLGFCLTLATSLLLLAACDPEGQRNPPHQIKKNGGFHPKPQDPVAVDSGDPAPVEPPPPTERIDRTPRPPQSVENPKPPPPPANVGALEYGKLVPGHPGVVISPHSPNSGWIDVRGFPPGSEVKDPYSGKNFLVPAQ